MCVGGEYASWVLITMQVELSQPLLYGLAVSSGAAGRAGLAAVGLGGIDGGEVMQSKGRVPLRQFGRHKVRISALGFGGHHLGDAPTSTPRYAS